MIKLLIGGSPCTYWSIAQTNNRETEPSGMGWELFENYLIAIEKFKPDYFLYENNKSMSKEIRAEITKRFGFEPVCINSALVSAQNRKRLYWCGKRNNDGTYSMVEIKQPNDRKIYLDELLLPQDFAEYNGGLFIRKKPSLKSHYNNTWQIGATGKSGGQAVRVYDLKGKSVTMKSQAGGGGAKTGLYLVGKTVKSLSKSGVAKCQTIPEWYEFPVSEQQAITLMGNGWTVDVIVHILSHFHGIATEPLDVLSMYDGMACGHIALDKLGATIKRYRATEIDKYAIKTACHNFPDIVQLGDAFDIRKDDWNP